MDSKERLNHVPFAAGVFWYIQYGLEFNNPDFVKYAESYGARGHRIGADSELPATLETAFTQGRDARSNLAQKRPERRQTRS